MDLKECVFWFLMGMLITFGVTNLVKGLDISSSVQGDGIWEMTASDGNLLINGGGDGSIAFAQSMHMMNGKSTTKASINFDGVRGTWGAKGNIGPMYNMKLLNATSMRLTTDIDALTAEESTGAIIESIPMYFATLRGNATGRMAEYVTDMSMGRMGRPIELSKVKGMGTFVINTTVRV